MENVLLVTAVQDSDGQAVSCAFDTISKSLQKLTLTSDDEKSVLILAEGSEYFLVRYGLMEYEVPDYAPDGREITTTMLLPNLRLIAKSDYWNNIPNYILLDDYVYSRKSHYCWSMYSVTAYLYRQLKCTGRFPWKVF